jgi:hypothetical protein
VGDPELVNVLRNETEDDPDVVMLGDLLGDTDVVDDILDVLDVLLDRVVVGDTDLDFEVVILCVPVTL